jgi:hypothetical protein
MSFSMEFCKINPEDKHFTGKHCGRKFDENYFRYFNQFFLFVAVEGIPTYFLIFPRNF